ncbi:uncharacterized protein LOC122824373 [Gambusia affinis]|uniref:uncharacterized protein LOC122824373 n=1 Tax=Gambusia affinis TaxID=33528 RepID=UPI001CDB7E81|nr:uncharacterized protein LOC122824373 [Gambusia affinis]XP_043960888.1 uncharacterized protein LOC122824373 [Gambusia affinis]
MKRRRKSSVFNERTSSDSMKKDEETSEHEDKLEDQTLSLQSTDIFSPMERRRDESSDLDEPSSDQISHQSEAAEGLSDVLDQETETDPVPLPFLGSETEEITKASEGTPRQPDTESVGSVSSLHGEGGNSLYSFHPFDCGMVVVPPPFFTHEKRNHPFFMNYSWGKPLYQRRVHSLIEEHEADAEQTFQGEEQHTPLDLSLPSNTRFINVSPPAVTSTSTADTSLKRLDFSLSHQDESHSQYVGPSRTVRKMPEVLNISELCYVPHSGNVSTVRPPELPDVIQPMGEQYSRQNSAGNNQDEIMESVGHVSYSVPNRSASTGLLRISKHKKRTIIRRGNISRYQSDSATEMEEKHQEHQNKSLHQGEESSFTNVQSSDLPPRALIPFIAYAQQGALFQHSLSSSTSRKLPIASCIKMEIRSKQLKQAENPAADEDQLERPEDLEQVISPNILTPLPLQQPLTTDSSKEEPISCSMDHNVPLSSDPTQSHSDPNRSASTDLLLPSGSGLRKGDLSNSSPSLLCPLTHQDPPLDVSILPRAASLPNMKLQSSFEEFTPGFCGDAEDETYWFQCSSPGLYQCRVSGLVFDMKGGGDVFYRVVPWNRRFLSQHGKKPAGPLFDISCQQQSVAQLHLPHCEVRSTGRCHFLSVAHLRDESIEFIRPERITETHIIISITGFSAFGNVKDEDSPPDPVRALVLLFYKPPDDPESEHEINVLMLPKNVVLRTVLQFRKKFYENEGFIESPPDCKLQPKKVYSLFTSPGGDPVLLLPKMTAFYWEYYEVYFSSFQVPLRTFRDFTLSLVEEETSNCVWKQCVHLSPPKAKISFFSSERMKEIQSSTIDRISVAKVNPHGAELHSSAVFQTKDVQGQSQPSRFSLFSRLNPFHYQQKIKFDKDKQREIEEKLQKDLYEVDKTQRYSAKLPRSTSSLSKISRYGSIVSVTEHSLDLPTSKIKCKALCLKKKPLKTLKQTYEDHLKQTEELDQFAVPGITPLSLQQPLTTDSSKEELMYCSMDHNVPPSSDPTQSHSDPNRSAYINLPRTSKDRKQISLRMKNRSRYRSGSATEIEERHQDHQNKSFYQRLESSFTNLPSWTWLRLRRFNSQANASSIQHSLSSSTSRKESVGSGIKMETLTENPAADEDQLERPEDLEQVISPNILTPLPLQQPLTTDSSKEEPISCSMDHIVPLSSDPTQSHSVPNRSASTDLLPPSGSGLRKGDLSNSSPSLLCPLTHQDPPLDVSILPRAASLPNMKLQSSFEEFTPGFCGDAEDETYWFQCSSPGLYQCRVSGLVFDMKGGGDVFYRVVPWNRRLLSPHGKKPAGPLFDISCQQQSVAQLHLPHCEVRSTGRCHFLSVAHLRDESVEFIRPERITETHIIISITGFSAFGNVKDEDSPPDPVRALVLLFYKPPDDPESEHEINVLMLPKNVVLNNVLRFRKKLDDNERFLETPPNCKLQPNQFYSLSVSPGGDSVLVQPKEAEFDAESYENYVPTFQVVYEEMMKHVRLSLTDSSSCIVWERRVCLSAAGVRRSSGPTRQNLSPQEQLMEIRISFMEGVSGPVLQSLLDNLLEEKVINDFEREAVEAERTRGDRARVLIDTVRRKGDVASSKMIRFLCELDHHFSERLGLM